MLKYYSSNLSTYQMNWFLRARTYSHQNSQKGTKLGPLHKSNLNHFIVQIINSLCKTLLWNQWGCSHKWQQQDHGEKEVLVDLKKNPWSCSRMDLVQLCSQLTINKIRTVFKSEKYCLFQEYFRSILLRPFFPVHRNTCLWEPCITKAIEDNLSKLWSSGYCSERIYQWKAEVLTLNRSDEFW